MKFNRILSVIAILSLLFINIQNANSEIVYKKFSKQLKGKAQTKRLPAGTRMKLQLLEPLGTSNSSSGDDFNAVLAEDQIYEGILLLPKGSAVRGSVKGIINKKSFSRGAILYIDVDHIVAPNGRQLTLDTGLCGSENITIDGGFQDGKGYGDATKKNLNNAKKIITNSTQWGINTGNKGFEGGGYVLAPFCAVGSTFGAGAYLFVDQIVDMFKKGADITLNQDYIVDVMLIKPLDVPIN